MGYGVAATILALCQAGNDDARYRTASGAALPGRSVRTPRGPRQSGTRGSGDGDARPGRTRRGHAVGGRPRAALRADAREHRGGGADAGAPWRGSGHHPGAVPSAHASERAFIGSDSLCAGGTASRRRHSLRSGASRRHHRRGSGPLARQAVPRRTASGIRAAGRRRSTLGSRPTRKPHRFAAIHPSLRYHQRSRGTMLV